MRVGVVGTTEPPLALPGLHDARHLKAVGVLIGPLPGGAAGASGVDSVGAIGTGLTGGPVCVGDILDHFLPDEVGPGGCVCVCVCVGGTEGGIERLLVAHVP